MTTKLYAYDFTQARTYLFVALFIIGNILLPQLCHLIPNGGPIFLPIFFFTLVGAYKYGWRVGVLTAIASPLANSMLFGMPAPSALPLIICQSVVLAIVAALTAQRTRSARFLAIAGAVVVAAVLGAAARWAFGSSLMQALDSLRIALPGLLIQMVGGWAVIKYALK